MQVTSTPAKSILTPQHGGLLASPPYPFTHSLSPYTGCAFGNTACGRYCYAQFLPNWVHAGNGAAWGSVVRVKENAAELLEAELDRMGPARRRRLRVFMASATDPYQPIEARYRVTRRCLEIFARYPDLDLLRRIPYAWLSVTVETDDEQLIRRLGGGPPLSKRLALVEEAGREGIKTQVAVSPCLAYSPDFTGRLLATGARRFVVDTLVDGDGGRGSRTARSPIAPLYPDWRDRTAARELHESLRVAGAEVGWSAPGFCGIPPRVAQLPLVG